MKRNQYALDFFDKWGFWPICGGQDELDETDEDDQEDDEDEDDDPKPPSKKGRTFTQKEVNEFVADRLKTDRRTTAQKTREAVEAEFERKQAEKDKDVSRQLELANKELEDLRPLKAAVVRYSELAEKRFTDAVAALPEHIAEMAPDEDADPLEKETWLVNRALPAAKKYLEKHGKKDDDEEDEDKGEKKPKIGNAAPKPKARKVTDDERLESTRKHLRSTGGYVEM